MKWFVYYNDDYYDNGGVGLESFDSKDEALAFINGRIASPGSDGDMRQYTLIEGRVLALREVERVKEVTA